jgi:hypothetical protein
MRMSLAVYDSILLTVSTIAELWILYFVAREGRKVVADVKAIKNAMTYQLQAFCDGEKVIDTTVVWTSANSHPLVGQVIDDKWRVLEVLKDNTPKIYRVRVERAVGPTESL